MKIPKTPIEFDYDLWTTEDGKCMVRVKRTGEVTEVDREVMRILRLEEKKLRRSYAGGNSDEDDSGSNDSILSLDMIPEDDVKESSWLTDPRSMQDEVMLKMCVADFRKTLCELHLSVFDECLLGDMTARAFAAAHGISKSYVSKIVKELREGFSKFYSF